MCRRGTAILILFAALWTATPANGYRFFARHGGLHRIASVAGAIRWDASAFPLRFRLLENENLPDIPGFDAALWRESVERGIRAWTEIDTADLEIVLEEETVAAEQGRMNDGINTIGFSSLEIVAGGPFATADVQYTRGRVTGCDIHFSPDYLEGRSLDAPTAFEELLDYLARTVMHEVGHCLGLAHSAMNPTWLARPGGVERPPGHFPDGVTSLQPHPRMSYGTIRTVVLEPDDSVGASLLYPAPGFVESRGALAGRVRFPNGQPAPFVYVQSVVYAADGAVFGAGAFTDAWGQFLLEGLEPGLRHFWVRPLHQILAHSFIADAAAAGSLEL
ncbi:MAG: hypothetical protein OXI65_07065, partial [Acidobacteriota bacterium]|nr:hypothetical protein [Acidobacteriota bacterium]